LDHVRILFFLVASILHLYQIMFSVSHYYVEYLAVTMEGISNI
jgi:hypothetical protein